MAVSTAVRQESRPRVMLKYKKNKNFNKICLELFYLICRRFVNFKHEIKPYKINLLLDGWDIVM